MDSLPSLGIYSPWGCEIIPLGGGPSMGTRYNTALTVIMGFVEQCHRTGDRPSIRLPRHARSRNGEFAGAVWIMPTTRHVIVFAPQLGAEEGMRRALPLHQEVLLWASHPIVALDATTQRLLAGLGLWDELLTSASRGQDEPPSPARA